MATGVLYQSPRLPVAHPECVEMFCEIVQDEPWFVVHVDNRCALDELMRRCRPKATDWMLIRAWLVRLRFAARLWVRGFQVFLPDMPLLKSKRTR